MIKMQEDFFNKILPPALLQGFERAVWGFTVRGSWRPNINCNILTPNLWPSHCVFLVLWCSTRGPEATLLGDGFLYGISDKIFSTHQGPKAPSAWCGFPYHICLQLAGTLLATWASNSTGTGTQFSYIIVRHPLDLWNRMFNRHQAEITVMQFRGHSLPVHHSVVYHGNFF